MDKEHLIDGESDTNSSLTANTEISLVECVQLYNDVSNTLEEIQANCRKMERVCRLIGTPRDNDALRKIANNYLCETTKLVGEVKPKCNDLIYNTRNLDKSNKLFAEKLNSRFTECYPIYCNIQRELNQKLKQNLPSVFSSNISKKNNYDHNESFEFNEEEARNKNLSYQQSYQKDLEIEQCKIIEREDSIRKIESEMLDINDIMKDISTLVQSQGTTIETIDGAIENTHNTVEDGRGQVEQVVSNLEKRKRKLWYVALFFITTLIISGIIIYFIIKGDK